MDVNSVDRYTIRTVISQQITALQQDNAELAFSFASPAIQSRFGTAENFLAMVKTAYAAVYRPRSVMFQNLTTVQGIPAQEVILLDPDGNLVKALYLMERQPDETWKIGGCYLMPVQSKES